MAKLDDWTITVRVNIKWGHLLKLLLYRTLRGRNKITIQDLINGEKKCTHGA